MKKIPTEKLLLFKTCLVSTEYPGVESSTTFLFDQLGIEYHRDERQSCCSGLGYYYDLFDQLPTTVLAARNFYIARETGHPYIAAMCATCYAILKKAAKILEENDEARNLVNQMLDDSGLGHMAYHKGDMDPHKKIFHTAEVLHSKRKEIEAFPKIDFSQYSIATHHGCHYCKIHYHDTICGVRNPLLLDEVAASCGVSTIDWYDQKRLTCGAGFGQRFTNNELSLKVTAEKLMSLKDNQTDILLHMCPNCQMQFDRYQPVIEKKLKTNLNIFHLNISQFMALAMGADPYKVVGIQTHTVPVEPLLKKLGIDTVQKSLKNSKLKINE
ncbi:ferredoxin:CoB-CoM heterodisulfide reductase subunit HdrB [Methanobacterium subterraneum]|uniref:Heterodisulfide reductase subunit B n=1 Tax=Methanobacterium subterraneum TaxID=59277 RepID=A0A7K4DQL6_9EURY|nr:ferredoxin:CoB-CoM heterodisulfide reductase subunit HdrB [Methanobacterium subterraneum]MBW4257320.1 CoB--CoM heterodisulfide reductase iron-sulfur subunit B family protein [Methanobacterium sp. YSL]NMO10306.1 heterodisulfide reductase subunit B [Methanobacterium subterraneum]